jgi:hypothetical protein
VLNRNFRASKSPTFHILNVTHKLKKSELHLKIRLKNATAQTAHLFFPNAKKSQHLKKIKELFLAFARRNNLDSKNKTKNQF